MRSPSTPHRIDAASGEYCSRLMSKSVRPSHRFTSQHKRSIRSFVSFNAIKGRLELTLRGSSAASPLPLGWLRGRLRNDLWNDLWTQGTTYRDYAGRLRLRDAI